MNILIQEPHSTNNKYFATRILHDQQYIFWYKKLTRLKINILTQEAYTTKNKYFDKEAYTIKQKYFILQDQAAKYQHTVNEYWQNIKLDV